MFMMISVNEISRTSDGVFPPITSSSKKSVSRKNIILYHHFPSYTFFSAQGLEVVANALTNKWHFSPFSTAPSLNLNEIRQIFSNHFFRIRLTHVVLKRVYILVGLLGESLCLAGNLIIRLNRP